METRATTIRILRRAAEIMAHGGFLEGDRGKDDDVHGAHCALGAIDCARATENVGYGYDDSEDPAKIALADFIRDEIGNGFKDPSNCDAKVRRDSGVGTVIAGWNNVKAAATDNPAKEVACKLRATAELMEEEGAEVAASNAPIPHD